jgi:hypothetical protein
MGLGKLFFRDGVVSTPSYLNVIRSKFAHVSLSRLPKGFPSDSMSAFLPCYLPCFSQLGVFLHISRDLATFPASLSLIFPFLMIFPIPPKRLGVLTVPSRPAHHTDIVAVLATAQLTALQCIIAPKPDAQSLHRRRAPSPI